MAKPTRFTQEMIDDYSAQGLWDRAGIADLVRRNARLYPLREAIVDSEMRLTWSALNRVTDRVAAGLLESGIRRDHAIVAQLPSSANTLMLLLSCHKAGILCCFPPMSFRHMEMGHVLKTLGAVAVLTPGMYRGFDYLGMVKEIAPDLPKLRHFFVTGDEIPKGAISFRGLSEEALWEKNHDKPLQEYAFNPFEVSVVVLSSGSTGMPKCIEYTGASLKAAGWGIVPRAELTEEDVFEIIAPLSGGPGLQTWWAALQLGAKVCLLGHFTPEGVLQLIQGERATFLSAVPTQLIRILKEADLNNYDISSLRVIRTGASAFDPSFANETEERMKCKVVIAGGSQETHSFAQGAVGDPAERRLETLGKPFPGNEIKIIDDNGREVSVGEVGALCVRGAATSSGYYGNSEATLAAWGEFGRHGWFRTGDRAKLDEQGYLILVGREKEMILRGGQNIHPREIEDLLFSHPKVMQAVVIGIPDQIMGERACAFVTLVQGQEFDFEEMISFLRDKGLAVHKLPERLEVLEELPTLADGQKFDKKMLADKIIEALKAEGKISAGKAI